MRTNFQLSGYQRQQLWRSLAAGLFIGLCGLALVWPPLSSPSARASCLTRCSFEKLDLWWLFKWRASRPPPPDVAVIAITEDTSAALNFKGEPEQWPSRTVHARLIERLVDMNVGGIVFDLHFRDSKPGDDALELAIKRADRVILSEKWKQEPVITKGGDNGGRVDVMYPPKKELATAAKAHGPSVLPKGDPATSWFWTFMSVGDRPPTTAALALQLKALAVYEDWLAILKALKPPPPGIEHLPARVDEVKTSDDMQHLMQTFRGMFQQDASLQQRVIQKIDPRSDVTTRRLIVALAALYAGPDSYYLNFYGPPGTITPIPYESLLKEDGIAGSHDLSHTMVFVGRSDTKHTDSPDQFYTFFTKDAVDLNGAEIMATAYANLLSGRTLTPSPFSALAVVAFGLVAGILTFLLPATLAVPAVFAITALYAGLLQWRFNEADLWLPLTTPALVQLPLALLIGLLGQYLLKRRKEEQMTKAIRYYLPESLVRDLAQREVDPTTLNRVVFGTCLATDMSDFVALAELKSPHELAVFMNQYFDALAQALKRHGVDVMEFRADMIMCAWIAPSRSAPVCRKGMEAAIEVSEIVTRFAQQHGSRHFNTRVGLKDGDVYVGHTGGGGHFLYSIVGDTANTAARLQKS